MKVAIIRFPGSNCDQDAFFTLRDHLGLDPRYVWHEDTSLAGFDAAFLPGGFAYGDYLRCGAIAARAPIMEEVRRMAQSGWPVIGVCNGFQVLCEAAILPGVLLANAGQKFVCKTIALEAVSRRSFWTDGVGRHLRMPVAHGEGRYTCTSEVLKQLEDEDRIAFRYVPVDSETKRYNPNGSLHDIAGVVNEKGNVLGLMPHPERAASASMGSTDGLTILRALTLVRA